MFVELYTSQEPRDDILVFRPLWAARVSDASLTFPGPLSRMCHSLSRLAVPSGSAVSFRWGIVYSCVYLYVYSDFYL